MKLQRNYSLEFLHVVFIVEIKGETVINVSYNIIIIIIIIIIYHIGGKITKC